MLFEDLAAEDFRKEGGRILVGRDVLHGDDFGTAQFAHLKQLAVDVPRVLRGGKAMTKIESGLIVGANLDGPVVLVADELEELDDVEQLDREISGSDEFGLARRHGDAMLTPRGVGDGARRKEDHVTSSRARSAPISVGVGMQLGVAMSGEGRPESVRVRPR